MLTADYPQCWMCYAEQNFAYFTTQKLEDQHGDSWGAAPYEHNAGEPYEPCRHNHPKRRNDPDAKRGWRPGTEEPLEAGELCRCDICKKDWNEDGTPAFDIKKVVWDGEFSLPCNGVTNSNWSVADINAGAIAWLCGYDSLDSHGKKVIIPAGTTLPEFYKLIRKGGGDIYTAGLGSPTLSETTYYRRALEIMQGLFVEKRSDVAEDIEYILEHEGDLEKIRKELHAESRYIKFTHNGTQFEYDTLTTLVEVYDPEKDRWDTVDDITYTDQ